MKTGKFFLLLGCSVMFMLFMANSATAGCAKLPDGSSAILTDPNARGTKLSGPLTLFYNQTEENLYYFLRLRKGSQLYVFAGQSPATNDWINQAQFDILPDWFEASVVPYIFGTKGTDWVDWELKSYDRDILSPDDPGEVTLSGQVSIIDIVLAVDEN